MEQFIPFSFMYDSSSNFKEIQRKFLFFLSIAVLRFHNTYLIINFISFKFRSSALYDCFNSECHSTQIFFQAQNELIETFYNFFSRLYVIDRIAAFMCYILVGWLIIRSTEFVLRFFELYKTYSSQNIKSSS